MVRRASPTVGVARARTIYDGPTATDVARPVCVRTTTTTGDAAAALDDLYTLDATQNSTARACKERRVCNDDDSGSP